MIFPSASPWDGPEDLPSDADRADERPARVRCPECNGLVGRRQRTCLFCGARRDAPDREPEPQPELARPVRALETDLPVIQPLDGFIPTLSDEVPEALPVATAVVFPTHRPVAIPVAPRHRRPPSGPPRPSRRTARPGTWGDDRGPPERSRLSPMFAAYAVMLGITASLAVLLVAAIIGEGDISEEDQNWVTAGFEGLVALLVLGVAVVVGRVPGPSQETGVKVAAWVTGFPILGVLLALNFGFTAFLRWVFKVEPMIGPGLTVVTFFLVCVQPGIIEEWYFRYVALGALRKPLGTHGAVWISGLMFGCAHILNPIAIPYLILVGACLGYLRVWSGSLVLPMILHFTHNLVVVMSERVV